MNEWVKIEDLGKYRRREKIKRVLGQIKHGLTPSEGTKKVLKKGWNVVLDAADRAAKAQKEKPVLKKAPKKRPNDFMLPTQGELDKLWR